MTDKEFHLSVIRKLKKLYALAEHTDYARNLLKENWERPDDEKDTDLRVISMWLDDICHSEQRLKELRAGGFLELIMSDANFLWFALTSGMQTRGVDAPNTIDMTVEYDKIFDDVDKSRDIQAFMHHTFHYN